MSNKSYKFKKKKIIIFAFEGKNNKTEMLYFSHFQPCDNNFILKKISSGCTDPQNMLNSVKRKRSAFDYNAREDLTFIFIDTDGNLDKIEIINRLKKKVGKDIHFIVSSPCFELWFLNHFKYTCREFGSNEKLIKELKAYIPNYEKNLDVFNIIFDKLTNSIKNSTFQSKVGNAKCKTNVHELFEQKLIK